MANALIDGDFGGGFGGYAGGGAGRAWANFAGDKRQCVGGPGHRRRALCDQPQCRCRFEVSLLPHRQAGLQRRVHIERRALHDERQGKLRFPQPAREPGLQLQLARRGSADPGRGPGSAAAASARGTGDPDLRGRIGDPGDLGLPGAAATATAAARSSAASADARHRQWGLGSRARSTRVREFVCQGQCDSRVMPVGKDGQRCCAMAFKVPVSSRLRP